MPLPLDRVWLGLRPSGQAAEHARERRDLGRLGAVAAHGVPGAPKLSLRGRVRVLQLPLQALLPLAVRCVLGLRGA